MRTYIVGCGGIGSYLAEHLDRLIELEQIKGDFTFWDDDVVEKKNMLYQNFEPEDIDSHKTEALEMRYFNLKFKVGRLKEKDLHEAGLNVLCADNNIIRREAYKVWQEKSIPFIDSRANGRAIGIFSSETSDYLETLSEGNESTSCQNPFQIEKKEIEYGNVIVAAILAQTILTYYRTNSLPHDFMERI